MHDKATKENWHEDFIVTLAAQLRPKIYVELGLYRCELFNKIIPYADYLIGVNVSADAEKWMHNSQKTTFLNLSTDEFANALGSHPILIDLLFIDADHSKESVLSDFWNFFPYVKDDGVILLHDTYPKNQHYTDKGLCGDAYRAIDQLKEHSSEFELMTVPIPPGLTIVRKRKRQVPWIDLSQTTSELNSDNFDSHVTKSISMPTFVSKIKQVFPNDHEIETIVEIGALDGKDSQYFKKVFPHARVCAIEALPENFDRYLKKLEDIECFNALISNIDGPRNFYKKEVNGIHSIFNRGDEYGGYVMVLPSYRFDTFARMQNIKSVDVLKLDVEGATIEVLEGMGEYLYRLKIIHLESESFPFFEGQKLHSEVVSFLERNGFSLMELTSFPIQPGRFQYDSIWINKRYVSTDKENFEGQQTEAVPTSQPYKVICITQIFNEIRKENLPRFWQYIQPLVDGVIVYDDGSTDGSYEYLQGKTLEIIRGGSNDFKNEINHKKILLDRALNYKPDFILWLDADEVLSTDSREEIQILCRYAVDNNIDGIALHEVNLWRSSDWKRTDNSYDLGWFVRLWRVTPDISFSTSDRGLHQQQYPHSIKTIERVNLLSVIHFGFASNRSLAFKYLVYRSHGQKGWELERLLDESTLTLERVSPKLFPRGLYRSDDKPEQRLFRDAVIEVERYRREVFKPRVSIICLIYKSLEWLKFVYQQVLKYTNLEDKEFYFVANDASPEVLEYLNKNYIPHYVWTNSEEQKSEWYINNVYRAWNFGARMAKGDYLLFINSDMAFSEGWDSNLFDKLNGKNCVTSRLIESGKLPSGEHAISLNFGRLPHEYQEASFNSYSERIKEDRCLDGGLFMPLLINKGFFDQAGGYPEGNIVPGSNIFQPEIARKDMPCISGDVVLMQKLSSFGVQHQTSLNSLVYHFQCGEMDSSVQNERISDESAPLVFCNDYLQGRMGEQTMWGFLLSNMPNSIGLDVETLNASDRLEDAARNYILLNCAPNTIIVQNASFISRISHDFFSVLYLQDNLRGMGRHSAQQEENLSGADVLVANSSITAASYPEYMFEIIPIGVNSQMFAPMNKAECRAELHVPNCKVGIFVGDFSAVKGWLKVKTVIDNHPEMFWIVVSKDNNQYNTPNCVTFNRISQHKLAKLFNCADVFILGSPVETQCLAAIEACLCGVPVVMHETGIFADFLPEERDQIGYFGEDFEVGLNKVLHGSYYPRDLIIEKKLTVEGMVEKWRSLISKYKVFADQKNLRRIRY